ncbi:GNAT family N-acetyltransferase [Glycomyces paridis]|uniref:GNAT family N-acetyltransferase n=1 Tax=Glycomyces paridis TaxID=2126555 RepID=A0A4S8NVQ4_9ACTN|nr:GNAT family N-acetyltransferase [Glycomyces paridis]THV21707.1 GNAT family N-acetyltransferase [Glycomyces paridis]
MSPVEVRPARPDEYAAVAVLRWRWEVENGEAPAVEPEAFASRFAAWAAANEAAFRCVAAVRDGAVVGMAWLAVAPRVPTPLAFERAAGDLQSVYLVPEERSGGVGSRMVAAVLDLARELGLDRVTVHSGTKSIPVYARNGFEASPKLLMATLP